MLQSASLYVKTNVGYPADFSVIEKKASNSDPALVYAKLKDCLASELNKGFTGQYSELKLSDGKEIYFNRLIRNKSFHNTFWAYNI